MTNKTITDTFESMVEILYCETAAQKFFIDLVLFLKDSRLNLGSDPIELENGLEGDRYVRKNANLQSLTQTNMIDQADEVNKDTKYHSHGPRKIGMHMIFEYF